MTSVPILAPGSSAAAWRRWEPRRRLSSGFIAPGHGLAVRSQVFGGQRALFATHQWTQTQIYLGVTITYLMTLVIAPLVGWLLDRGIDLCHAQRLATFFGTFPLLGIALLAVWPGQASAYIMAVSLGFAVGSEGTILMYLGGRYFAPGVLGSAMSLLLIVLTFGAASGPAVAALMHAHFGSYGPQSIGAPPGA